MPRGTIIRQLTEDLGAKGVALGLAVILWGAATFLGTRTVAADGIPVGVTNLRGDLALTTDVRPVRVTVRAPRLLLQRQSPREFVRASIDLAGRGVGAQSVDVAVSSTDPRVDVLFVLPARVDVVLEPVVQRALPVRVVPEGDPADGFRIGETTVEPATVQVRGPLGKLQETPAVDVPVPMRAVTTAVEDEFPLRPPPALAVNPERVRVRVDIIQAEETRTLGIRVATRGTVAAGYWVRAVTTDPVAVTVRGTSDALVNRTFIETEPIDVAGARSPLEKVIPLRLPDGLAVVGAEPRVRVNVAVEPLEGAREVRAPVDVQDVPDDLRVASVTPTTLHVVVRGTEKTIENIREGDVRVFLSARGRGAGPFSVRPSLDAVVLPTDLRAISVEDSDVTVSLESR